MMDIVERGEDQNKTDRGNPNDEVPPPAHTKMRLMIASMAMLNPLFIPMLWWVGRGYKRKWRQGFHGAANVYLKQAVIIFVLGVILTTTLLIILILLCVFNVKHDVRHKTNDVNIYATSVTSTPMDLESFKDGITKKNISEITEKTDKSNQFSALKLPSPDEVKILYRNKTFMRIHSERRGIHELHVPAGFLHKLHNKPRPVDSKVDSNLNTGEVSRKTVSGIAKKEDKSKHSVNLSTQDDFKVLYRNETYMRIDSEQGGIQDLQAPAGSNTP